MTADAARSLRVDGQRLWSRLMEMGTIGATANGGCNRQALTAEDGAGRALLLSWAREAGCSTRVDAIGNLFLRRAGSEDGLPAVLTGSHLDTQPTGGRFDGIYGVLAGLEALETMHSHGVRTRRPIEVAIWCNEEGCRFPVSMMGSAVWAGRIPAEAARALKDRDGTTVGEELARMGIAPGEVERQPVAASVELHIEQGPVLEQRRKGIGIVTGVQHMSRHEVLVEGQEAHAGPTPMELRRDPVRVLATVLPQLYAAAERRAPDGRITFGIIEAHPGSPNTVPGKLRFTVDLRHPDADAYQSLCSEAHAIVNHALTATGLSGSIRNVWEAPGVTFARVCIEAVRTAARDLGLDTVDMVSGAGHDSCNVASVVPTSMIFIPCAGGLSHNERESATPGDVEAGANVLLQALLKLSETVW